MCAGAISFARLRRLYFGAADEKGGAVVNGVRFFASPTCHHTPDIYPGMAEADAALLLKDFFRERREAVEPSTCRKASRAYQERQPVEPAAALALGGSLLLEAAFLLVFVLAEFALRRGVGGGAIVQRRLAQIFAACWDRPACPRPSGAGSRRRGPCPNPPATSAAGGSKPNSPSPSSPQPDRSARRRRSATDRPDRPGGRWRRHAGGRGAARAIRANRRSPSRCFPAAAAAFLLSRRRLHQLRTRLVVDLLLVLRREREGAGQVAGKLLASGLVGAVGGRAHAAGQSEAGRDKRRQQRNARVSSLGHAKKSHSRQPLDRHRPKVRSPSSTLLRRKSGDNLSSGVSRVYLNHSLRATRGRLSAAPPWHLCTDMPAIHKRPKRLQFMQHRGIARRNIGEFRRPARHRPCSARSARI